ncbi:MAG: chromate transporter [Bdellovibrionales bacterium]|nr:chromate transporter [Bdellovibrionales bacterium]
MSGFREVFTVFVKIGAVGFGGPLALIAMIEQETVKKLKWLPAAKFSEITAVCKALPGPVGALVSIQVGRLRAGTAGGLAAGLAYFLPAFFLMLALSAGYSSLPPGFISQPLIQETVHGLQIGALALILVSALRMAKPEIKSPTSWTIGAIAFYWISRYPSHEPALIVGSGIFMLVSYLVRRKFLRTDPWMVLTLFWICIKAGAFTFGTGLAIVPLLEGEFVQKTQWLSRSTFLDGLVLGQITPGPVIITTTFLGYQVAGWVGACVATLGIFLPAFILMLVIAPRIWDRVSGKPAFAAFTSGAIPAVIGSILATWWQLTTFSIQSIDKAVVLALLTAASLRLPSWATVGIGGLVAWIRFRFA